MKNVLITAKDETPAINLNPKTETFTIRGKSFPENPAAFYMPILDWFNEYAEQPNEKTDLHCHIQYMNSASNKMVFEIFHILEKAAKLSDVTIFWHCEKDDLTEEHGIELEALTKCKVEFVFEEGEDEDLDDLY